MEFKEIYGYQVSECGVILSKRNGKPLTPHGNGRGYLIVHIRINGKSTSKGVHRLVAEAWIDNPDNLSDVNHKDCNKHNNHKDNLAWMTHGENIQYSFTKERRTAVGESNARCITTEEEVREICRLLSEGNASSEIRDMGFDYNLVRAIKRRKNWTHISENYKW